MTDRELGALLATVAWIEDEPIAKALSDLYARAINEDTATTETRYAANRKGAARYNQIVAQQTQPDLRDAMIEALESTPYSSIEFAPGLRYLRETIIAGLTQATRI